SVVYVIPGTDERLELRERRMDLPGHGSFLGFLPDDLGRKLLEIAQHRKRKLDHLDLTLELRPESLQRDRILRLVLRGPVDVHGGGGMVEGPLQIERECRVRLLVESEPEGGSRLVPARIVVVARRLVE